MKVNYLVFFILFFSLGLIANAQNNMYIHKEDGSVQTLSLVSIDSITYTYGNNNPLSSTGAGVTFDGFTYTTIVLGNGQEWMVENLRTSVYANGDPIVNITDNNTWANTSTAAWCYFNNDNQYETLFGKLYNWFAVDDTRNVCPTGWHVPTDLDWDNLLYFVDPNANVINSNIAGGKLKSTGTVDNGDGLWDAPNTPASNEYNFYGYPSGERGLHTQGGGFFSSNFRSLTVNSYWWSSTEENVDEAFFRTLENDRADLGRAANKKVYGMSIRCIKD